MKLLSHWFNEPLEIRTRHIDLTSPCDITSRTGKPTIRKNLLSILGIEDDVENWGEFGMCLCHHCDHDSGNGWCRNPLHLHIGTWKENWEMRPDWMKQKSSRTGADVRSKLPYDTVVERMTGTVACITETGQSVRISVDEAKSRGLRMTTSKPVHLLDETTGDERVFGTMGECATFLGVHTPAITRAIRRNGCVHRRYRPTLLET